MRLRASCLALILFLAPVEAAAESDGVRPFITVDHLASLTDIGGLSVSPGGDLVAFQVRRNDPVTNRIVQQWMVIEASGGIARILADGGEPFLVASDGRINGFVFSPAPIWSPDGLWLTYLRKEAGRVQLWRVHREGGEAEQLTYGEASVRSFRYSGDGSRLIYEVEYSQAQLQRALAEEGRVGFLYGDRFSPGYSLQPILDPGNALIPSEIAPFEPGELRIFDFAERIERRATPVQRAELEAGRARQTALGGSRRRGETAITSAGAVAWTEARDPNRQGRLAPVTIVAQVSADAPPTACAAAECVAQVIRGMWWRSDEELIFARGEGPHYQDTVFYSWRVGALSPRQILRTPARLSANADFEWRCAMALDRLVCFFEEPSYPRRLAAVDLDTGAITVLFDPNPSFAQFNLGAPPERMIIRTATGVETYGYLVLPPELQHRERLPLVVVSYRCDGFLRGGTGDEYPIFPLAAQGFAVLCYNAADTDYELLSRLDMNAYARWAFGEGDPEKVRVHEALIAAIDELDERGIIDRSRVGLTGLSFGASIVGFALPRMEDIAAAIVSGPPGYSQLDYYLMGPSARAEWREFGVGSPHEAPDRWRTSDLIAYTERVRSPLLLNVASSEALSALQAVTALEDAGRPVEMYIFPGEYHVKSRPAHRLAIYQRNVDWLNFWLRGVEDVRPDKRAQYLRWRDMRGRSERLRSEAVVP